MDSMPATGLDSMSRQEINRDLLQAVHKRFFACRLTSGRKFRKVYRVIPCRGPGSVRRGDHYAIPPFNQRR
jgi:hypothetical protein